jgi:hypothetical protein
MFAMGCLVRVYLGLTANVVGGAVAPLWRCCTLVSPPVSGDFTTVLPLFPILCLSHIFIFITVY